MSLPQEIVEQFAKGNGVLFVGPDLSMLAGLPDMKEIAKELASELGCPADLPPAEIAQHYAEEYSEQRLFQKLEEQLDTMDIEPPAFYSALLSLPIQRLFTTNYDDLLEKALDAQKRKSHISRQSIDVGFDSQDRLNLVKLHGDFGQREKMVVTSSHYHAYFEKHRSLVRILQVTLQTKTVLFLGYQADDPNFEQLLTLVRNESENFARNAFAVLMDANEWTIKRLKRHQITVINLESSFKFFGFQQKNDYSTKLTHWLEQLSQEIEAINGNRQLTTSRPLKLPAEPYKFLDYFEQSDAAIFHGRAHETEQLIDLILTSRLSILYGESGSGKTSLLRAAVLPHARLEQYKVAYARPLSDTLDEIRQAISGALSPDPVSDVTNLSLTQLVAQYLRPNQKLLLVLDQFEEFFIRQGEANRHHFIQKLTEILNQSQHDVRCLVALRSDYLDRLDALDAELGKDPLRNRMRLYNLGAANATAAISEPAKAFEIPLEPMLLDQLISDLQQNDIAPAQLQIVCHELWQDWKSQAQPAEGLTLQRYGELGETTTLLTGYLDRVIDEELKKESTRQAIGLHLEAEKAVAAAKTILKSMISAEQTKIAVSRREMTQNEFVRKLKLPSGDVTKIVRYLRDQRIIRRLEDNKQYELAHEVMIEKVWAWVSDKERQFFDLRDLLTRATNDYTKFGILLSRDHLIRITEDAATLSPGKMTLELLLYSAVEEKLEPTIWANQMEPDHCIEVISGLLETAKPIQLPNIARALGATRSSKAIRHLTPLLEKNRQDVYRAAIDGLVTINHPSVVPPLYQAVRSENRLDRVAPIIEALEVVRTEEAIHILLLLATEHSNPHVCNRANAALTMLDHPQSFKLILSQLDNPDTTIQRGSITLLGQILQKDPTQFDHILQYPKPTIRALAIEALGELNLKDECMTDFLIAALQDEHQTVRSAAVTISKRLNVPDEFIFVAELQDENYEVRIAAIKALDELSILDEDLIDLLIPALKDQDIDVRVAAIHALGKLNPEDERVTHLLVTTLQDEHQTVRRAAMLNIPDELILKAKLQDENHEVRIAAIKAIGNLDIQDKRAVDLLALVLQYENSSVHRVAVTVSKRLDVPDELIFIADLENERDEIREAAIKAISKLNIQDECMADLLNPALWDKNFKARKSAIQASEKLNLENKHVANLLIPALWDRNSQVRKAAIQALGKQLLKDEHVADLFTIALSHKKPSVRVTAIQALGKMNIQDEHVAYLLIPALQDKRPSVRAATVRALGQLNCEDERIVDLLISTLEDKSPHVRIAAIQDLGELNLEDKHMADLLIPALQDKSSRVRITAIQTLDELNLDDEHVTQSLIAALQDVHQNVRKAAANALRKMNFDDEYIERMSKEENASIT